MVTSVTVFTSIVSMLGYFVHKAHGPGRLIKNPAEFSGVSSLHGSALGWQMAFGITTQISSKAQGILGYADWGRYGQ